MDRALGCDISHWNPPRDWEALSAAVSFVGIKATEGQHTTDSALAEDLAGARGEPFALVWLYHVARGGDGAAEARRLMDACGPLRPNERYCLDTERSSAVGVDFVEAFFDELPPANERQRFFYTSNGVWVGMGNPDWAKAGSTTLILPRYGTALEPVVPKPWDELSMSWGMWQQSQTGRLPGIDGDVDLDVWNGDVASLRAFAALPAAA